MLRAFKLFAVIVIGLALVACGQVDQQERAIFKIWGKVDPQCYGPGLYFYNPFSTNMDEVHVGVQAVEWKGMGSATKDLQEVHADVVVNYTVDGSSCHKMFSEGGAGSSYREIILGPALFDSLKSATAKHDISEIIKNRAVLRDEINQSLATRVREYGILVPPDGVKLVNFDVSKAYMAAVEAKQIAEQNVIRSTREAESARAQAKGQADAAREAALGQADAQRTNAKANADALLIEAKAQAEYNRVVSESLTPILIQNRAVQAWREGGAQVPKIVTGDKGGFIFQLPGGMLEPPRAK